MTGYQGVDTTGFQVHPGLVGEDEEDTDLIRKDAERALRYIGGFRWAPPVKHLYLAWGIGRILCLFLVKFERPIQSNPDDEVWVVVGDLPSAYFETDIVPDIPMALETYCGLMEDWADTVLEGGDLSKKYPVEAAPSREHAEMLKSRIQTIRELFIPHILGLPVPDDESELGEDPS